MIWLPEYFVAGIMFLALVLYVLTGGADFGGGVWDLLATGPRAQKQRDLLAHAIGPIWEANHVWLIIVVVLMFVAFPSAFATMTTLLHIPLTVMLVGIVLRGSAFVFRTYDSEEVRVQKRWGVLFAIGSIVTPLMLGITLGALASGALASGALPAHASAGTVYDVFIVPWLKPFPIAIGVLTLALCAFLGALYAIFETDDEALKSDFRKRALASALLVGCLAGLTLMTAKHGAPRIYAGLLRESWSPYFQLATGLMAVGALGALVFKYDLIARVLGMAQVALLVSGWALAQFPYLIVPIRTIRDSAAPRSILLPVLAALGLGAIALVPAYTYLFIVFKGRKP